MVVGYSKDDSLTQNQKLIAGVISGITTRFVTQPLDIVKIRTQLQSRAKSKRGSWLGLMWRILKEEGVLAFWHGHSLGQIHSILSVASQFYAYELCTRFVEDYAAPYTSPQVKKFLMFMSGIVAGSASAALVSPIEVIRVRQMVVKAQYGGILQGARVVYRSGGFLAFYEGLPASIMQMGPQVGITFAMFRLAQPLILEHLNASNGPNLSAEDEKLMVKKNLLISSSVGGAVAGFVSKTATYPFDLAKRRLQIASHKTNPEVTTPSTSQHLIKCRSLMTCLMDMVRKVGPDSVMVAATGGVTGLFTGWSVTIYKAQLNSVAAFTTYEMMCNAMREYNSQVAEK